MISSDSSRLEYVILVDANDQPVGIAEKLSAHQAGLLHRAFSVCVLRPVENHWEILLQQRAKTKYHSGGLWTNTCCSHPSPGEDILAAGQRRLQEEMGFSLPLQSIGHFIYRAALDNQLIEHELDYVLIGQFGGEIILPSPPEVMAYRWQSLRLLTEDLQNHPQLYTAWLSDVVMLLNEYLGK